MNFGDYAISHKLYKGTTLGENVEHRNTKLMWGQRIYRKSLNLPLNLAVNLTAPKS